MCILAGNADTSETQQYVDLVLRVYFDTLQLSLHPFDTVIEGLGRLVEPPLGLWLRFRHQ